MVIDDERIRQVGVQLARRDHAQRKPQPSVQSTRFWAPTFRVGYHAERARLGDCPPDRHIFRAHRITADSDDAIRRRRIVGSLIEVCERCGVWQDYVPHREGEENVAGHRQTGRG